MILFKNEVLNMKINNRKLLIRESERKISKYICLILKIF